MELRQKLNSYFFTASEVYLYRQPINFRKSHWGLSAIIEETKQDKGFRIENFYNTFVIRAPLFFIYNIIATNLILEVYSIFLFQAGWHSLNLPVEYNGYKLKLGQLKI